MFRYRTLFGRISAICITVLVVALLLFNVLVSLKLRSSRINSAIAGLSESAGLINAAFSEYYESGDTGESIYSYIQELAQKQNCIIWIADAYDRIVYVMSGVDEEDYGDNARTNKNTLTDIVEGGEGAYTISEEEGMFYAPLVTVGSPIKVEGETIGAVYLHLRLTDLSDTVKIISGESALILGLGILLSLGLSYMVSRWIARPLYDMNKAALALARGNFKQRIKVRDNSELGQLSQTFNMMVEELEKYENTRESFVGNVSHELRSPITAIQGFVQGMLDGTIDESERRQYLEIVLGESRRMNALIRDLLDLVKIESGQFPLKKSAWDINELIRRTLINYLNKIEDKKIELAVNLPDTPSKVLADYDRIAQVFTNLLDNAVKFCNEGGSIKIWTYEAEGKLHVSIANTGQTIPKEDLRYIFDRFFKVDKSHNRKTPGTGIGLSIVREIINLHNEKIWVNSKPGTGTVFTFTLTLALKGQKNA